MPFPEVFRSNLLASKMHGELVGERDPGKADRRAGRIFVIRLLDVAEISARIPMGNDFGDRKHLHVAAGMIVVLMGVQDITQWLVSDRFDLREDVGVVSVEHVVDENDTFRSDVHCDVAAFTRDHIAVSYTHLTLPTSDL